MQVNQVRKTEKWGENQKNGLSLSWREVRVLRVQVVRALLYNVYISAYLRIIPQAQMGSVLTQRP